MRQLITAGKDLNMSPGTRIRKLLLAIVVLTIAVLDAAFMMTVSAWAAEPFMIHLLDVGQGQCVLVEADGSYMLVDGGGRSTSSFVVSYLKGAGVETLDYVVQTHFDEDHMGGTIGALSVFPCRNLLLPSYEGEGYLYESFLRASGENECTILYPEMGDVFSLGGAYVEIIGPVRKDYQKENDGSLALKVVYADVSCLISGDTEWTGEEEMALEDTDITADIYIAGHHGSASSSTDVFLDRVHPSFVLISCGAGNMYGHPAEETLKRLKDHGCTLFRTDLQGTIVASYDGSSIRWNTQPCDDWTPGDNNENRQDPLTRIIIDLEDPDVSQYYVLNTNTMKFHYPDCPSVSDIYASNRQDYYGPREDVIAMGTSRFPKVRHPLLHNDGR